MSNFPLPAQEPGSIDHAVAAAAATVSWRRVWSFYAIAFGGAVLAAVIVWVATQAAGPTVGQAATAVLYMPLPIAAALIVERVAHRRPVMADEFARWRSSFWRTLARSAAWAVIVTLAVLAAAFGVAAIAGALSVPGAGRLVPSDAEFQQLMAQLVPGLAPGRVPPLWLVVVMGVVGGLAAGVTVNAVFAFGEEYGWRGFLANELRPLGVVRANLVTGVLWGLWHAPIIVVMGHNYPTQRGWGVLVMVAWTVPLSFVLWWVRERAGSVFAAACAHGCFNGTIGLFAFLIVGGSELVALPVGLLLAVAVTVLAAVLWVGWPPRERQG